MLPKYQVKISKAKIEKALRLHRMRVETAAIRRFQFIGETFVKNAREKGDYNDITGNLRSSVGYAVVNLGLIVAMSIFEGEGKEGVKKAIKFMHSLKGKYPDRLVLFCFAAMKYAVVVESRGRDVITGSVPEMKAAVKKVFKSIKNKTQI